MSSLKRFDKGPSWSQNAQDKAAKVYDQLAELKSMFSRMDNNGDGKVSMAELKRAIKQRGMNCTKRELKEFMIEADKNEDGYMTYKEFERIMAGTNVEIDHEKEMLLETFKRFDLNGDGFITKNELQLVLTNMGDEMAEEQAAAMVEEADLNGDGRISFDEFVKVICKKT